MICAAREVLVFARDFFAAVRCNLCESKACIDYLRAHGVNADHANDRAICFRGE
jgi:hypothetical protein